MSDLLITALSLRRNAVSWTSLRENKKRKGEYEVAEQCDAPLALPEGVSDPAAPEAAPVLKAKCGSVAGNLTVALPTERVLMRVVQLPSTDPAELRSMAELQVDKFCPFPLETMSVGLEILAQSETGSRVLIAAAQLEHVEQLGETYRRIGLHPRHVDVESLGWWWLLKQSGLVAESGRQALVLIEEHHAELIITQGGVPVVFRSLGALSGASPEESATEMADEINYTLTALETEWGAMDPGPLQVWHPDTVPPAFFAALRTASALDVRTHSLEALSSLSEGLVRRAARPADQRLDLAPAQWSVEMQDRRARRSALLVGGAALGVWLAAVLVFFILWQVRDHGLRKAKAEAARLAGPAKEVRQIKDQVLALQKYGDRQYSGLECLREVSERLPDGVDLTSFSYKKYKDVSLRGEAESSDPIYEFIDRLEDSAFFTNVAPEGVTDEIRGGKRRSTFRVTCGLRGEES